MSPTAPRLYIETREDSLPPVITITPATLTFTVTPLPSIEADQDVTQEAVVTTDANELDTKPSDAIESDCSCDDQGTLSFNTPPLVSQPTARPPLKGRTSSVPISNAISSPTSPSSPDDLPPSLEVSTDHDNTEEEDQDHECFRPTYTHIATPYPTAQLLALYHSPPDPSAPVTRLETIPQHMANANQGFEDEWEKGIEIGKFDKYKYDRMNPHPSLHAPLKRHLAMLHPSTPPEILHFCATRLLSTDRPYGSSSSLLTDHDKTTGITRSPVIKTDTVGATESSNVNVNVSPQADGDGKTHQHMNVCESECSVNQGARVDWTWIPLWQPQNGIHLDLSALGLGLDAAKGVKQLQDGQGARGGREMDQRVEGMYKVARESWRRLEMATPGVGKI